MQTAPTVCMHCAEPSCVAVCPTDAIKMTTRASCSRRCPRCIGCGNCALACPFGVPKYVAEFDQMMKCDMCTDRTSEGLRPVCASVCPSEALWYGTPEEFHATRRRRLVEQLALRPPGPSTPRCFTVVDDPRWAPSTALDGITDPAGSTTRSAWTNGLMDDENGPRYMNRPVWNRDFPYEAAAEEAVAAREFARYLVARRPP